MTDLMKIKTEACKFFLVDPVLFDSKLKNREIAKARQIAMKLAKDYTKHSLAVIGEVMGGRDHCTVLHACKTVNNLCETDKWYNSEFKSIKERVKMILSDKDIVIIKATVTLKNTQFQGLGYYFTFKDKTYLINSKIHSIEIPSICDLTTGFNLSEVERIDIEIINYPVAEYQKNMFANEPVEIVLA